MEKAREIMRLSLEKGLSQREIASGIGCSLGMVNAVLTRMKRAEVKDPLSLSAKELGSIIYPPVKTKEKPQPDFAHIDRELKKK